MNKKLVLAWLYLLLFAKAKKINGVADKTKKYNIDTNSPEFQRKLQQNYLKLLKKNFNMDKRTSRKLKQTMRQTIKLKKKGAKKRNRKLMGALGGGLAIGGSVIALMAGQFLLKRYTLVNDIGTLQKNIKFNSVEIDKFRNLEGTVRETFFNAYEDALGKVKKLEEMLKNKSVWLESDIDAALQEESKEEHNEDDNTDVIEEADDLDQRLRHRRKRRRRKRKLL